MRSLIRMFKSSTGYFSSTRCPKLDHCKLPNCIFSHRVKRQLSTDISSVQINKENETLIKKPKLSDSLSDAASKLTDAKPKTSDGLEVDLSIWAPRTLPGVGAPASIQQRIKYITNLIQAYQENNIPFPKKTAVDEEYKVASKSTKVTYGSNVKSLIKGARENKNDYSELSKKQMKVLSHEESFNAVKKLVHTVDKLDKNHYVTKVPTQYQFQVQDRNLKKCDHCSEHFYLSKIQENTKCQYHDRRKTVVTKGSDRTATWDCCSQPVGESQGCKILPHHVFKAAEPLELHELIPFRKTPEAKESRKQIVGMDCEMGYTTKGMEVIRVTIMDFFTGSVLFDEVVKPSGTIIDLNTQWSGVDNIPNSSMSLENVYDVILGTVIDEETIIVGHGLENDLNVLRLIHHNVVDTAILFPKSLTRKYGLKDLAFQFLDRKIQGGEHSSEEDSLAAIDIIKAYIAKN